LTIEAGLNNGAYLEKKSRSACQRFVTLCVLLRKQLVSRVFLKFIVAGYKQFHIDNSQVIHRSFTGRSQAIHGSFTRQKIQLIARRVKRRLLADVTRPRKK
jgi:hypothetical protein